VKSNFATDTYSTAGGLATVAYNDPDFFREVNNQIFQDSPTADLDLNLPSSLFSGSFDQGDRVRQIVEDSLTDLKDTSEDFSDWLDVNEQHNVESLSRDIENSFFLELDRTSSHRSTMDSYLSSSINQVVRELPEDIVSSCVEAITSSFRSDPKIGKEIDGMVGVMNNNPFTKITNLPPDVIIPLDVPTALGKDYRGVDIVNAYLTPFDYYSEKAFTGSINKYAEVGYIGYPTTPLESLYNPAGSTPLGTDTAGTTYLPQVLSQMSSSSRLSQNTRDLYNLSLMAIDLNGLTSFDPATMSNGDYLDISVLPKYADSNLDTDGGVLPSSRAKKSAF